MNLSKFLGSHNTAKMGLAAAMALGGTLLLNATTARAGDLSYTNYSVVTIGGTNGNAAAKAGDLSTGADITGNAFVTGSVTQLATLGQDLPTVAGNSGTYALRWLRTWISVAPRTSTTGTA